MNIKSDRILLSLFFLLLVSCFIFPVIANSSYGIKDNSEYVWNVNETISEEISYQLTAKFNLRQRNVSVTKYFHSNGSYSYLEMPMNLFRKFILASHEKQGSQNYFYTGSGALNFPRHVTMVEDAISTQVVDTSTGITLHYTSDTQEHVLISGTIPISWVVWILLGITIGLSSYFVILLYKRGKPRYQAIVYDINIKT